MKNLLKVECKRVFSSKVFYFCLGIGAILCIWLLGIQVLEVRTFNQLIQEYGTEKVGLYYPRSLYNSFIGLDYAYLPSTILYTIFPLLVTLPHAMSYYRDKRSGYIKNILIKADKRDYYVAKYLSVFLSGFIVTSIILFFSLWISAICFPAILPEVTTSTYLPASAMAMYVELYYTHPLVYTVVYIFIDAVFYGIIATIALLISSYADNILYVFAGGMILYLITDYITGLVNKREFSPLNFLRPTQISCNAKISIIVAELILLIVLVAVSFLKKEREKDVF